MIALFEAGYASAQAGVSKKANFGECPEYFKYSFW
jgi:hypothetical protein